jgi:hypothetical protein
MLNNFDDVNGILADLAEQDILEPMVEPIDEPTCHPMDWAEVTGLADEMADEVYPEDDFEPVHMIDERGAMWYTF